MWDATENGDRMRIFAILTAGLGIKGLRRERDFSFLTGRTDVGCIVKTENHTVQNLSVEL